ncbi:MULTISPECIES: hypothetical protein [Clostridiaceae]|nr:MULTISPECIES: hypothetical protein [Clostridiaceae]
MYIGKVKEKIIESEKIDEAIAGDVYYLGSFLFCRTDGNPKKSFV